jgi:hypothetical protein
MKGLHVAVDDDWVGAPVVGGRSLGDGVRQPAGEDWDSPHQGNPEAGQVPGVGLPGSPVGSVPVSSTPVQSVPAVSDDWGVGVPVAGSTRSQYVASPAVNPSDDWDAPVQVPPVSVSPVQGSEVSGPGDGFDDDAWDAPTVGAPSGGLVVPGFLEDDAPPAMGSPVDAAPVPVPPVQVVVPVQVPAPGSSPVPPGQGSLPGQGVTFGHGGSTPGGNVTGEGQFSTPVPPVQVPPVQVPPVQVPPVPVSSPVPPVQASPPAPVSAPVPPVDEDSWVGAPSVGGGVSHLMDDGDDWVGVPSVGESSSVLSMLPPVPVTPVQAPGVSVQGASGPGGSPTGFTDPFAAPGFAEPVPTPVTFLAPGVEARPGDRVRVVDEVTDVLGNPVNGKSSAGGGPAAVKVVKKRPGRSKSKTIGGIRLTGRDMQIMSFLARYRMATVGQLARRFQTSETALRNRLPMLEKAGLISWAWAAQTKPKIWLITDQGLKTVGMSLTVPTVSWGQLRHTLGLVDLGVAFELGGEIILTEREIRAAATRYSPTSRLRTALDMSRYQGGLAPVPVDGLDPDGLAERIRQSLVVPVQGRAMGHIPDMVLARQPFPNGASGNVAVELELTRKGLAEWRKVLGAYQTSPYFAEVYYFVTSRELQRGLEGVIKALGAGDKIKVVPFTPVDQTADPTVTGGGA